MEVKRKVGKVSIRKKIKEDMDNRCSVEGCYTNVRIKGLCNKHYTMSLRRKEKGLDCEGSKLKRLTDINIGKTCKEIDCSLGAKTKGYCQKHYIYHWRKKTGKVKREVHLCKGSDDGITPCNKDSVALGLCPKHYKHYRLRKEGKTVVIRNYVSDLSCEFEGCEGKAIAKNLCNKHYVQENRRRKKQELNFIRERNGQLND